MEHDAWFFIGVFVFIFLVWIATGGPIHKLAFSGPQLALPGALGGGSYLSLPKAPFGIGGSDTSLVNPSGGSNGGNYGTAQPAPEPVGGMAFGEVSPYRRLVSLNHYVSSAGASDPRNEYIELNISGNFDVPVNISGWTLVSDATGNSITIPKGTELPSSGILNAAQDIVLEAGDRAIIISGQSPIGASFRENKCIGYFSNFQNFAPSLPQNCPLPSSELTSFYGAGYIRDTACIDYVNTLSRCQVALTPPPGASGGCQSFLVKYLNYNGCVDTHRNDSDFKGNMWHVYLGRSNSMWRTRHEVIKLLDANGKTIDAFTY